MRERAYAREELGYGNALVSKKIILMIGHTACPFIFASPWYGVNLIRSSLSGRLQKTQTLLLANELKTPFKGEGENLWTRCRLDLLCLQRLPEAGVGCVVGCGWPGVHLPLPHLHLYTYLPPFNKYQNIRYNNQVI